MSRDRFAEESERINRKARRLVNEAGVHASRNELEKLLDQLRDEYQIVFDAEDRQDIITRAAGLQLEARRQTEMKLAPEPPAATEEFEEPMSESYKPDDETRKLAREHIRKLYAKDPEVRPREIIASVREKFPNLQVTDQAIYYWMKPKPKVGRIGKDDSAAPKNGARKKTRVSKRSAKPNKAVTRVVDAPPPVVHLNGGAAVITGDPILQIFELSNGNMRVQFDMPADLGNALHAVGAALNARKAHV